MTTAHKLIREQLLALADDLERVWNSDKPLNLDGFADRIRSLAAEPVVSDTAASGREAVAWGVRGDGKLWMTDTNQGYAARQAHFNNDALVPLYEHPPAADVVYQLRPKLLREAQWTDVVRADYEQALTRPELLVARRLIVHPDDIRTVTQEGLDRG